MELSIGIIEPVYTSIVVAISLFIFFRARELYELSGHKGIKSFRNAFLFWAMAFALRYVLIILPAYDYLTPVLYILFNYLLSMAGFSLVYSLVYKSLNTKEYLLHLAALLVAITNVSFNSYFMFVIQIAVLVYAIIIGYSNYREKGGKFSQLYFIALILALIGYLSNFLQGIIAPIYPNVIYYVYGITLSVFLIFLYNVVSVGRWQKKESA